MAASSRINDRLFFTIFPSDASVESSVGGAHVLISRCATRALVLFRNLTQIWEAERESGGFASRPRCCSHLVQMKRNRRWVPVRETIGTVPRRWVTNDLVEEEQERSAVGVRPCARHTEDRSDEEWRGMRVASYLRFPGVMGHLYEYNFQPFLLLSPLRPALKLSPPRQTFSLPPNFN